MAKELLKDRAIGDWIVVQLYLVGGTVSKPWYTVEVRRRGTKVGGKAKIVGDRKADRIYRRFIERAERGEFDK